MAECMYSTNNLIDGGVSTRVCGIKGGVVFNRGVEGNGPFFGVQGM